MALVIYTKPHCPYCEKAVEYFRNAGRVFSEYDAQNDPARQREMLDISGGDTTVPCIVEDGVHKGSGWGDPPRGCTVVPDRASM
ncbi:MAG: glutaredoxin 3 [Acidobacteria bacterium]|nr:glutaredoxin 3 [Acidobacteriota bacterium]MCW5948177.1 glutaredoxin 3 [Pyrinomonadaceae bacterium]